MRIINKQPYLINMNMYDRPTLVKILKKEEGYKVIYIQKKTYKKRMFETLLDAIEFACQYASRDEVIYSISL